MSSAVFLLTVMSLGVFVQSSTISIPQKPRNLLENQHIRVVWVIDRDN